MSDLLYPALTLRCVLCAGVIVLPLAAVVLWRVAAWMGWFDE